MRFKIMHIYIVEAPNRSEAIEKFTLAKKAGKEDTYFESEVVKKLEDDTNGWFGSIRKQVTGK